MNIKSSFCYFSIYRQLLTLFAMKLLCPVLSWFRFYLSERKQFVMIQDNRSSTAPLDFGAPQDSVLGHVLFILYIALLSLTIEKQSWNVSGDIQLCKSVPPKDEDSLVLSLQKCTADVDDYAWEQTNAKLYYKKKEKRKKKRINNKRLSISLVPHLALLTPSQTPSLSALETFSLHRK